jgi:eukaryotic-like serine/threonine-protein kinase
MPRWPARACYDPGLAQLDQIGKYKILGKIGQGAMGEVFRAHDSVLNRPVAIKTISADLGSDDTLRKRFEREAQSAARLNHPNIITVFDFGEDHHKIFMAMELLEGQDLKQAMTRRLVEGLEKKLDIMDQVCDGLAFAHAAGIVHRDLKPANIHLLPNGQIKIMDFGLARLPTSEMTRTGMVMGTPHYMSPEQVRGEKADARSDVFALGCTFYELLSQRKPFDADSMHGVLFKVMQEDPPPLSETAPTVPRVVAQVLAKALAKDPAQRFQDAAELRSVLRRAHQAVGEGRGQELLPDLPPPPVAVSRPRPAREEAGAAPLAAGASAREGGSVASASGSGARSSASGTIPPVAGGLWLVVVGAGAVFVVLLVFGLWFVFRPSNSRVEASPPATTRPAQVNELARTLAASQAELAQKRLVAGDYNEALRQAEKAVRLDPTNAEAQDVVQKAGALRDRVEKAATEARRAMGEGGEAAAADALWNLLVLDPHHPAVTDLLPRLEKALGSRSEEARRRAAQARSAAEKANASGVDAFKDAVNLSRDGDTAAKASRFATATQKYLEAAAAFERAGQAVK